MQEHTATKEQDQTRGRRSNPIHIVESGRGPVNAETLRDMHLSLVRAEQNLYNLVQASHASNGSIAPPATYAFTNPSFPGPYAPAFPPGIVPTAGPHAAFGFGVPSAQVGPAPAIAYGVPATGWGSPAVATASGWTPLANGSAAPILAQPFAATAFAPGASAFAPGASAFAPTSAFAPAAAYWNASGRTPACDIADEGKQFVCQLDLPGLRADQVELLCLEHTVVVSAFRETESDSASLVQSERSTVPLQRTILLPSEILPAGVKATLSNGVLTIVLPKANPTEGPRRVKVQG